jgi:hypothetical protein
VDPDPNPEPDWIRIQWGFLDLYPDAQSGSGYKRAKMTQKKGKADKLHLLKCWMFSFEGGRPFFAIFD